MVVTIAILTGCKVVATKKTNDAAMVHLGYLFPLVVITVAARPKQDSSHVVASISIASSLIAYSCFVDGLELHQRRTTAVNPVSLTTIIVTAIIANAAVLSCQDFRSTAMAAMMDKDGSTTTATTIIAKLDSGGYCCFI